MTAQLKRAGLRTSGGLGAFVRHRTRDASGVHATAYPQRSQKLAIYRLYEPDPGNPNGKVEVLAIAPVVNMPPEGHAYLDIQCSRIASMHWNASTTVSVATLSYIRSLRADITARAQASTMADTTAKAQK